MKYITLPKKSSYLIQYAEDCYWTFSHFKNPTLVSRINKTKTSQNQKKSLTSQILPLSKVPILKYISSKKKFPVRVCELFSNTDLDFTCNMQIHLLISPFQSTEKAAATKTVTISHCLSDYFLGGIQNEDQFHGSVVANSPFSQPFFCATSFPVPPTPFRIVIGSSELSVEAAEINANWWTLISLTSSSVVEVRLIQWPQ